MKDYLICLNGDFKSLKLVVQLGTEQSVFLKNLFYKINYISRWNESAPVLFVKPVEECNCFELEGAYKNGELYGD